MVSRIAVIGLGLIGGSLCRALRRTHRQLDIAGVDRAGIAAAAQEGGLVEKGFSPAQLADACRDRELIILATPIGAALDLLPRLAPHTAPDAVVTDVCSLKREIAAAGAKLFTGSNGCFIGGHPMAGSEKSGFEHADPFLFENAIYVLTPAPQTPPPRVDLLGQMIAAIGAHAVVVEPELHDRIAAAVSHLPQLLAVALMQHVASLGHANPLYLQMAAGGFRDMTRIASSPFTIWRDICDRNAGEITAQIDAFIKALQALRSDLGLGRLEGHFDAAARQRLSIPRDTRGFLRPHFDVSVEVEDKPGIIARIATVLAAATINIKDIEVLKVRENEGGTIRLAFESEDDREQALRLLGDAGFRCRKR